MEFNEDSSQLYVIKRAIELDRTKPLLKQPNIDRLDDEVRCCYATLLTMCMQNLDAEEQVIVKEERTLKNLYKKMLKKGIAHIEEM